MKSNREDASTIDYASLKNLLAEEMNADGITTDVIER